LQEEDLTLHYRIPSKVVLFEFHRTFLWPERWAAQWSRPECVCQAPRACNRTDANTLAKNAVAEIRFPRTFLKRLGFGCHWCFAPLGCRAPAFSTLSTSSTAPLLHGLETSFNFRYLASCRFWYAICPSERCNRVTDAPESTRRLAGHISPQPNSVPIQARQ
jgi:hypothetical protein